MNLRSISASLLSLILATLISFSLALPVYAACSTHLGKVVINEVYKPSSGTAYIEIKVLDPSVVAATSNFQNWKIKMYAGGLSQVADVSAGFSNSSVNSCGQQSLWIRFPQSVLSFLSSYDPPFNFVLYDSASGGEIIDIMRIGATTSSVYSGFTSCSTIESLLPTSGTTNSQYDALAPTTGASVKDWYRTPDGTGPWVGANTANTYNTSCSSNDVGAGTFGLAKVPSVTTVATNTNFSYTLWATNGATTVSSPSSVVITDTLPGGVSFVSCTATAGTTSGTSAGPTGTCTHSGGVVTWTVGAMAANKNYKVTLTVQATTAGIKTNSLTSNVGSPVAAVTAANVTVTGISVSVPTVTTNAATSTGSNGSTLNGTVTSNGASTTVSFNYGTTTSYGSTVTASQSPLASNASNSAVSAVLTGLNCGTTYNYRVTATNSAGTSTGSNLTFTTSACPATFSAYETSVSNANAATAANRIIQTRVATTSGNLCKADGITCSLTVAGLTSTPAVDTGYSGTVTASLEYCGSVSRSGSGTSSTVSCTGSWTALGSSQNVTLTSGVGTLTLPFVNNAYEVVRVKLTNTSPSGTWYADDYFAIRPGSLTVTATDATSSTAGNTRSLTSGANSHKAGQPFTLNAQALASATTASNYKGTGAGPVTQSVATTSPTGTGLVNGTLTPGTWSSSGTLTSTTASYSEVGTFTLTLEDQDYANIDKADGSSTTDRYFSGSASLSRFTPDHFQTVVTKACSTFTYSGQPFTVTTTALNAANNPTLNYSLTTNTVTLSNAGVTTNLTSNTVASSSFSVTTGISTSTPTYTFVSATTAPATITIRATDLDSITSIGYEISAGNTIYSGRLRLQNAYGSELLNLPIPLEAQYWNGTSYVRNQQDNCTSIAANSIAMSNYRNNLNACETQVGYSSGNGLLTNGVSNFLRLTAPGAGNSGSVDLIVNLNGASGNTCAPASASANNANMPWFGTNPASRATFGIYKTPIIHLRENY